MYKITNIRNMLKAYTSFVLDRDKEPGMIEFNQVLEFM